jgi:O-6-methylguanine DNA methyltransferase
MGWTFCDTAFGRCAIAWSDRGITAVQLPEGTDTQTRERLLRLHPGLQEELPPSAVRDACDRIAALLRGEPADLSGIMLDMSGVTSFRRRVYTAARSIRPGTTQSYGEVAARLGQPTASRAVGQALGRNPFAIVVPCHRVVAANGRPGGFSAAGGVAAKVRLLALEVEQPAPAAGGPVGFGFDPADAVEYLRARDGDLRRVIDRVGEFQLELKTASTTLATLAEAIVYQQLGPKAAATIFGRLCALFPGGMEAFTAEAILATSPEELRGVGLSQAKLLALRDLAARTAAGELPSLAEARQLDDDALISQLSAVRGIGRWTAQMFLIFRLGRPDVLPADDYAIRRGFKAACGLADMPSRDEVERRGLQWRPYRTVASWYLWSLAGQPLSS